MTIMEFAVDLAEQTEPELLPTGDYPFEIAEATFKDSQNTGNTYLALVMRISPDAYPADFTEGDPDGTTVTYNRLVVKPDKGQNRWRVRKFLEAVGAKLGRTLDPAELIGLTGTLHVEQDEYDGEKRLQVRKVLPA
jgi:hypothetical protein